MPKLLGARPISERAARPSSVFQDIEALPSGGVMLSYEGALAAVVEAQERADRILQQASADAERICAEAREQAIQTRAEARTQGYLEGQETAAQEAQTALDAAVAEHLTALRAEMESFCEAVLEEQERVWRTVEAQLPAFALEIAARVVKEEVSVNPDVVLQITRQAMRRLAGSDAIRIRVNPDEVERMRAHRDEILALFEGLHSVEILEDRRVAIGGVQIETDTGTVDARIDTQISEIGRALEG